MEDITEHHGTSQNAQFLEAARHDQRNRYLTVREIKAIDELLIGKSITDTAVVVGVSRETLSRWKNGNPNFIAEFNRRQQENTEGAAIRLRSLLGKAVDVLEESLKAGNLKAAVELLKIVDMYGKMPEQSRETDAEMILARESEKIAINEVIKTPFARKPEYIRKYPDEFIKTLAEDIYQMKKAVFDVPSALDEIISENENLGTTPKGED